METKKMYFFYRGRSLTPVVCGGEVFLADDINGRLFSPLVFDISGEEKPLLTFKLLKELRSCADTLDGYRKEGHLKIEVPVGVDAIEWLSLDEYLNIFYYSNMRSVGVGELVGIEWEIPQEPDLNARRYLNLLKKKLPLIFERDASIYGPEVKLQEPVSPRMAIAILKEFERFRRMFPEPFRSKRRAGLHLHFNISDLSGEELERFQGFLFYAGLRLQVEYREILFHVYGRGFNKYAKPLPEKEGFSGISRYNWINLTSSKTVEFRLGSSKAKKYLPLFFFSLSLYRRAREFAKEGSPSLLVKKADEAIKSLISLYKRRETFSLRKAVKSLY